MSFRTESFPNTASNEMFDIPAAEEEVTLGNSGLQTHAATASSQNLPPNMKITGVKGDTSALMSPMKRPKVIMLQRNSSGAGGPPLKAVKIVTVPGSGSGGKPIKAAVIPMNLLNRGIRLSGVSQPSTPGQKAMSFQSQSPNTSRFMAMKSVQSSPMNSFNSYTSMQRSSMKMEDSDGSMLDLGGHQHMHSSGQFIELGGAAPLSPPSKDDYNDLDMNMNTPLKTNGLRRYARCVCNKVKEKGVTSYSEVADELVHEYAAEHPMIPSEQLHYIQKNIRRRVYDALNVLMALNVLQKEKKEIHWVGLPVNMIEECRRLEEEREKRQIALRNKTNDIQDLILQLIAFKNLIVRNKLNERYKNKNKAANQKAKTVTMQRNIDEYLSNDKIPLPFLVITTNKRTLIDANISEDKLQYTYTFDQAFEIRDDIDILKRMGLTLRLGTPQCQQEEFNQCLELVPPSMRFYVEAINARRQAIVPNFEALHQQRRMFVEAGLNGQGNEGETPGAAIGNAAAATTASESVKQIHFQHRGLSSSGNESVPGDTQHYARTAASRGYSVYGASAVSTPGAQSRSHQRSVTSILSNSQSNMMNPGGNVMGEEEKMLEGGEEDMKLNESLEETEEMQNLKTAAASQLEHHQQLSPKQTKRPGYQVRLTNTPRDMATGGNMEEDEDIGEMEDVNDEDY